MKEVNGMDNSDKRKISNPIFFRGSKNYSRSFIILSSSALFLYISVIALTLWNKKLRRRPANKFLLNLFFLMESFVFHLCLMLETC